MSWLREWEGVFRVVGEVSEKVIGGWVKSEGLRGVQRYPVWYVSGIRQVQKWGQDGGMDNSSGGNGYHSGGSLHS